MLLRFFVHFYDMEIIEEEAFLAWKEDITQEFPGKGKALFQVNVLLVISVCLGFFCFVLFFVLVILLLFLFSSDVWVLGGEKQSKTCCW